MQTSMRVPVFVLCVAALTMGLVTVWERLPLPAEQTIFVDQKIPDASPVVLAATEAILPTSTVALPLATFASKEPRLLFFGDIMLDRQVAEATKKADDPAYPFKRLPEGWIESFDFSVANLEGPVTGQRRLPVKSIDFQFDPLWIGILRAQGFDAFSQANNHTLDQGSAGYTDSVHRLREAGFLIFGHQTRDDALSLATTTVRGKRFAFLGFNLTDHALDESVANNVMEEARTQADTVIVFPHWGTEYRDAPDPRVVKRGHWFIDHGADAVIGSHPHWVQGISSYKGKLIAWSLGNAVFDQYFSEETQEGLALALTFGTVSTTVELFPLRLDASQPSLVKEDGRTDRLARLAERSDVELREDIKRGTIQF